VASSSAVVPDKRSEAERRSGTHSPRETFGEDPELRASRDNFSLGLWIPAFAGMTNEFVATSFALNRPCFLQIAPQLMYPDEPMVTL
jgi:hypothetical protein